MDPLTTQAAAKGAGIAGAGSAFTVLGNMAGLSGADWGLILFIVVAGISLGAYYSIGEVEAKHGPDSPEARKARHLVLSRLGVQFMLGIVAAAGVNGNVWQLIPACLVIGMSGPFISDIIRKFISIGGRK